MRTKLNSTTAIIIFVVVHCWVIITDPKRKGVFVEGEDRLGVALKLKSLTFI